MPIRPALIYADNPGPVPANYRLPAGLDVNVSSVSAVFNGAAASGTFLACLSLYSQDGKLVGRWFPTQELSVGDSGEVTYGPFLEGDAGARAGIPVLDLIEFEPVGNFLPITSTNPDVPDTVITASALTFDGSTTVKIEFFASACDVDQRGKAGIGALLLELYDGSTALGIIGDFNASNGQYYVSPCYVAAFDTPTAGSHTYSVRAYIQPGAAGQGSTNIYGAGITTPHVTRAGYLTIATIT